MFPVRFFATSSKKLPYIRQRHKMSVYRAQPPMQIRIGAKPWRDITPINHITHKKTKKAPVQKQQKKEETMYWCP